jgi:hypothetical protein
LISPPYPVRPQSSSATFWFGWLRPALAWFEEASGQPFDAGDKATVPERRHYGPMLIVVRLSHSMMLTIGLRAPLAKNHVHYI